MIPLVMIHALRLHEGASKHPAGNFHHMRYLVEALAPQMTAVGMRLILLVDELGARDLGAVLPSSLLYQAGLSDDNVMLSEQRVRNAINLLSPALYYRPNGQLPFGRLQCPAIMGVADINFRWLPVANIRRRVYKELSYIWSFLTARHIVCVSHATKLDIMQQFWVSAERISVIHHGSTRLPLAEAIDVGPGKFWLTFGHQAHKNVELCLAALARNAPGQSVQTLVVVGQSGHIERVLKPMARKLGVHRHVRFVGRVSDCELSWLYGNALALLFVSKFEGFGLPVLEAMQAGCPVIASKVCSLPEVAGDAALFVSPDDAAALTGAMDSISSSQELVAGLIAKGKKRAQQFAWSETARQTIELFKQVVSSRPPRSKLFLGGQDFPRRQLSAEAAAIPVLVVGFRRPSLLSQLLAYLQQIGIQNVYVWLDGPSNPSSEILVNECREISEQFRNTIVRDSKYSMCNLGCARSVAGAISWFFQQCEFGIIIEEDVLVVPEFFEFCVHARVKYLNDEMVFGINAHYPEADSTLWRHGSARTSVILPWGWATWRRAWAHYDPEMVRWQSLPVTRKLKLVREQYGSWRAAIFFLLVLRTVRQRKVSSWAYPWALSVWTRSGVFVTPLANLSKNFGFGSDATNTSKVASRHQSLGIAVDWRFSGDSAATLGKDVNRDRRLIYRHFNADSLYRIVRLGMSNLISRRTFLLVRSLFR